MARRQGRKSSAQRTEIRRPATATKVWHYWLMLAFVGLLAVVMVITSLPTR
jgi:hypothetical protein